jgi:uncharacterized DUF497 family protein
MKIEFDPDKRVMTLAERGLDMARAAEIFEGDHLTVPDDRKDYGEERLVSVGFIDARMVFVAWTQRGDAIRIISMRKANDREQEKYTKQLGR